MADDVPVDVRRRRLYHARLVRHLPSMDWALVAENLDRVGKCVQGELAVAALARWRTLVADRDCDGIRRAFLDESEDADLMRVVSPFAGTLPDHERRDVIAETPRGPYGEGGDDAS